MLPRFTTLGSGPLVLMLHGVDGGHLGFAPQVEAYAQQGYRAAAWDMPGYGRSAPVEPYDFKGLAARCALLVEALARPGEAAVLIGHGLGGMVAMELALRRPERVGRLVLASTLPSWALLDEATRQRHRSERLAPLDAGQGTGWLAQVLLPRLVGPGSLPEGVRLAEHCLGGVHPSTYRRALDAQARFDRQAELARLDLPVLVLGGEFDTVATPALLRAFAQALPQGRHVSLPGVGQWPNLEAPEAFDAAVLGFLADTAPGMNRARYLH